MLLIKKHPPKWGGKGKRKMKKQVKTILKNKNYLLGINQDNEKVWLQEATFDCDWYWGIGYIEIYNSSFTDINTHSHFNYLFLNDNIHKGYIHYFKDSTLNDNEIWLLLEYMKTLYTIRTYADTLTRGGSHITSNPLNDIIKNNDELERINKVLIPTILQNVHNLLTLKGVKNNVRK